MKDMLVIGGAGFIGSNFVRLVLREGGAAHVTNLDKLTYAGNPANLADLKNLESAGAYRFVQGDKAEPGLVAGLLSERRFGAIVDFAAESHVDRSIDDAGAFLRTNVDGTYQILEAVRKMDSPPRFLYVSTDEVYGPIPEGSFRETDRLNPGNPYSASKAAADFLVLSYANTYGTPCLVTRGANTYGPYQYPEKLIPLFTTNAIDDRPLPVYGDGKQVRDWLYVTDHARGILTVLEKGECGGIYNLGAGQEFFNIDVTRRILGLLGKPGDLIRHVEDRAGHDRRYSLDCSKAQALGWERTVDFEEGLERTAAWYREREDWWRPIKDGSFRNYYERQYARRLAAAEGGPA